MARPSRLWVPERGEIIFIEHSPHVGKSMPGLHPIGGLHRRVQREDQRCHRLPDDPMQRSTPTTRSRWR